MGVPRILTCEGAWIERWWRSAQNGIKEGVVLTKEMRLQRQLGFEKKKTVNEEELIVTIAYRP